MGVGLRIERGRSKPLLLSLNLGFTKQDPGTPKLIRLVRVGSGNLKIESLHFERQDIITEESQQTVQHLIEECDPWGKFFNNVQRRETTHDC